MSLRITINPIPSIEETWNTCQRDPRYSQDGADHLLYKIIDAIVMNYMPIIEKIDEEIDWIEDQVFDRPSSETLCKAVYTKTRIACHAAHPAPPTRGAQQNGS